LTGYLPQRSSAYHPDVRITGDSGVSVELVLSVVQRERGGVTELGHVRMLKSPVRRSRAGPGVQGVGGMVSLSR
jgi:hypothetical protein